MNCHVCNGACKFEMPVLETPLCSVACQKVYWSTLSTEARRFTATEYANPVNRHTLLTGKKVIILCDTCHDNGGMAQSSQKIAGNAGKTETVAAQGLHAGQTAGISAYTGLIQQNNRTLIAVYDGHNDVNPLKSFALDPARSKTRIENVEITEKGVLKDMKIQRINEQPVNAISGTLALGNKDIWKGLPLHVKLADIAEKNYDKVAAELFLAYDEQMFLVLPKTDRLTLRKEHGGMSVEYPKGGSTATVFRIEEVSSRFGGSEVVANFTWVGDSTGYMFQVDRKTKAATLLEDKSTVDSLFLSRNARSAAAKYGVVILEKAVQDGNSITKPNEQVISVKDYTLRENGFPNNLRWSRSFGDYAAKRNFKKSKTAITDFTDGFISAQPEKLNFNLDEDEPYVAVIATASLWQFISPGNVGGRITQFLSSDLDIRQMAQDLVNQYWVAVGKRKIVPQPVAVSVAYIFPVNK